MYTQSEKKETLAILIEFFEKFGKLYDKFLKNLVEEDSIMEAYNIVFHYVNKSLIVERVLLKDSKIESRGKMNPHYEVVYVAELVMKYYGWNIWKKYLVVEGLNQCRMIKNKTLSKYDCDSKDED